MESHEARTIQGCSGATKTTLSPPRSPGYIESIGYLERIQVCTAGDLSAFVPWHADGVVVGRVHRQRVPALLATGAFRSVDGEPDRLEIVGKDFATRSAAMAAAVEHLVRLGELRPPLGENYPVVPRGQAEARLQIDRTAVAWFGVTAAGVHLNGWLVRDSELCVWVAERARGKRTFPGHLDNLVAGGSAIGLSARQTLVKECQEEAGMPAELAARAVSVGAIRYVQQDGLSLKPDRLDLFDLELPPDFVPRPVDGEVEHFHLWPVQRLAESVRANGLWKPNCALVVIDFLLRRGALDRELAGPERWRMFQQLRPV